MAGKRNLKKRKRLPRLLGLCAALLLLLGPEAPVLTPSTANAEHVPPASGPVETPALPAVVSTANAKAPEEPATQEEAPPDPEPALQEPVDATYFADALFLGDSRTEGLSLYGGPAEAEYLFAVGATVESVFSKPVAKPGGGKAPLLDTLAQRDCAKVYVMLGVNELGWVYAETFRDQYAKVIDRIREDHPEAVVAIQSILPVSALQDAKGSYVNNERIRTYNALLKELAVEKDCPWLDVAGAVADESGCLAADLTFDGIHLNPAGCAVWLEYLQTHPV